MKIEEKSYDIDILISCNLLDTLSACSGNCLIAVCGQVVGNCTKCKHGYCGDDCTSSKCYKTGKSLITHLYPWVTNSKYYNTSKLLIVHL